MRVPTCRGTAHVGSIQMKRIIHTAEQIIGKLEGADGMGECLAVGRTLARVEMSQKRTSFFG